MATDGATGRPAACSDCKTPFSPGQSIFGSKSDPTAVLCESCAGKRMPICAACGKPILGQSVKMGDSVLHLECLRCAMCKKLPDGRCTPMGSKFFCGPCMDYIQSEAATAKELTDKNDLQGAAEIAQKLVSQGVDLPPELLGTDTSPPVADTSFPAASSPAASTEIPCCTLCSKQVRGQYSKMGKSVLCVDCGSEVRSQMQQAQELAAKGDTAGAMSIARALADRGLQELLEGPGDVPECTICSKPLSGKCTKMGEAMICETCGESVNAELQQVVELASKGEIAEAAKIARGLTSKGLKLPPQMMDALSQAPPSCYACSKPIQGRYAKTPEGFICQSCGESINTDIRRAQELVSKGDTAGAAEIARRLKAKGVPLPDQLTQDVPAASKSSMSQRPTSSGALSSSASSPSSTLAKAGAHMLRTEMGSIASAPPKEIPAETTKSNASAVDEVLAELAPPPAEEIPDQASDAVVAPAKTRLVPGSGPAYEITCIRAADCIKKKDFKSVQQIAGGLETMGTEVPEFIQKALDEWAGEAIKQCIEKGDWSNVQGVMRQAADLNGTTCSFDVPKAKPAVVPKADSAQGSREANSAQGSRVKRETVAGSGSSAAKALSKRQPKARASSSSLQSAKAKADSPPPAKAKADSPPPAKARGSVKGAGASTQPKAAAKAKAASAVASTEAVLPTNSTLPRTELDEPADEKEPVEKTEAPAGTLGVHRTESKKPVPFEVLAEVRDALDGSFASISEFPGGEADLLHKVQTWNCRARLHDQDWEVQVRGISAPGETSTKIALFLHGAVGDDRCFGFWAKFWSSLHAAGYHILTLDMPGHGRSSSRKLPARDAQDAELVLAVCGAFTDLLPGQISCFADAGGASAFIRAYTQQPIIFAAHHVLTNPVVAEVPAKLRAMFERHGNDLFMLLADGWSKSDVPFSIGNCAQMIGFASSWMERMRMLTLVPPEPGPIVTPGVKGMREPTYLLGKKVPVPMMSRESSFYCLFPSDECLQEIVSYVESPGLPPVHAGGPSAPMRTALEMGEVNESFRVFVRIRPMLRREETAGSASCVLVSDVVDFPRDPPPQRINIEATAAEDALFAHHGQRGEFVFDRVFEPGTQLEVFDQVARPLVESALQGTNVTMFAYGQTGTGKTYTMEGPSGDEGLIQNSVRLLFDGLDGTKQVHYQYVQLYNTDFKDLLDPESTGPFAVEEGKKFMKVRGAKIALADSPEHLLKAVARGAQYRASGKTNMNDASSRSHAVLCLMIAPLGCEPDEGTAMYMVDLAGSERVKRSGVQVGSQGFSEATSINTALSALGRVVVGLVSHDGRRAAHIPYKDNDLTYLLKSGIGGLSKTALICCITAAEDSLDESINTLRFALQASHVKNRVADKEQKDRIAAAAGAIEDSGNDLVLSPDGTGECAIPGGTIPVRGFWSGDASVIICIHDFGKDGSQFDALISELKGSARVLAPTFELTTEKEQAPIVEKILSLLDWLGVPKAIFVGIDYGAILSVCFKLANPTRAAGLVLENRHQKLGPAEYKAIMKAQPDYVMKAYSDCWTLLSDFKYGVSAASKDGNSINTKGLKGKVMLLWPCHFKGNPDPKMGAQQMAKSVAKQLRAQITDSYGFSDADVAEHVLKLLPKDK